MVQIEFPTKANVFANKNWTLVLSALLWSCCFLVGYFLALQITLIKIAFLGTSQSNSNTLHTFDWNDTTISQGIYGSCGRNKCFWRSVSDPDHMGYLVAPSWEYGRMYKGYQFAMEVLDKTCGAKHLLLEPPMRLKVESGLAARLNGLHRNHQNEYNGRHQHQVYDKSDAYLAVQKVRVAPEPNLHFGVTNFKRKTMVEKDLPEFRSLLAERDVDMGKFEANLEDERRKIECAMGHSQTYYSDLQGLVDIKGNYYHMDIDSQFSRGAVKKPVYAYHKNHEHIGQFNDMIQRLVHPPPEGVKELPAWDDDDK